MPLGLKRETPRSPARSLRPRVHPGHSALLIHGPDEWLKEPGPCTVAESQSTLVSAPADWTTEQLSHRMGPRRPVATLMLIMTSKTGMVTVRIISFIHYLRVKEIGYSSPHGIYDPFGGRGNNTLFFWGVILPWPSSPIAYSLDGPVNQSAPCSLAQGMGHWTQNKPSRLSSTQEFQHQSRVIRGQRGYA